MSLLYKNDKVKEVAKKKKRIKPVWVTEKTPHLNWKLKNED
jgi:hypothetical protein